MFSHILKTGTSGGAKAAWASRKGHNTPSKTQTTRQLAASDTTYAVDRFYKVPGPKFTTVADATKMHERALVKHKEAVAVHPIGHESKAHHDGRIKLHEEQMKLLSGMKD